MNLLERLTSLVEDLDRFEALRSALSRLGLEEEHEHAVNGPTYQVKWKRGDLTLALLSFSNFDDWVKFTIPLEDVSSVGLKTKCSKTYVDVSPMFRVSGCKFDVTPENVHQIIRALPRLISAAERRLNSLVQPKKEMVDLAFDKVREYLTKVAEEEEKKLEVLNSPKKKSLSIVSDKDGSMTYFQVDVYPEIAELHFFTGGLSAKNTLYFDANPLKRGAKSILKKFPGVLKVLYHNDRSNTGWITATIQWKDPSKMPEELVGILKEIRHK